MTTSKRGFSSTFRLLAGCLLTLAATSSCGSPGGKPVVETEKRAREDAPAALLNLTPNPSLTVYVINRTPNSTARVVARNGSRKEGDRLMVRAFNPDERITFWQYVEPGRMIDTTAPGQGEIHGIPIKIPVKYSPGDLLMDVDIPLREVGIHQIRVTAGAWNSSVSVYLPRGSGWGVCFQNGAFNAWKNAPGKSFVFIPPHAEELTLSGGPVKIFDETGKKVLESTSRKSRKTTVKVAKNGVVWRCETPEDKSWTFRACGFPFIICTDPESAETIHASVDQLADGTVVCWKFQKRIHDVLPWLLDEKRIGKTSDLTADLKSREYEFLKTPVKSGILLSSFDSLLLPVNTFLKSQDCDPKSHWGGAMDGWRGKIDKPFPENRWDRLKTVPGLAAGASSRKMQNGPEKMALAALLNDPANPYYGRKELLYRAAAACLRDLMALGEDEVWRGVGSDLDPYPGFMAFAVGQKTMPAFALAGPEMPEKIRSLWTEGLRHIVDRCYPDGLTSARNQSSHYLVLFEEFAVGSGLRRYEDLARAYAVRFVRGIHPSGFIPESLGPDASYTGMSHWHMAKYYRMTKDPVIRKALCESYDFFNHTVAPEPNGAMVGACNFNHRVGAGFQLEQWGGAKGITPDIPEVAVWGNKGIGFPNTPDEATELVGRRLASGAPPPSSFQYNITFARYKTNDGPVPRGKFPAEETESFTKNFGNQLIAVKRPRYYAAVYVGHPAPVPFYVTTSKYFRKPLPNDAENSGGTFNNRHVGPFVGGGLSIFWTKEFGTSLLGTSWSPFARHGLLAVKENGDRFWESYFDNSFKLDVSNSTLVVKGRIDGAPIEYKRSYKFLDDEILVDVEIKARKDVRLKRLSEVIPLLEGAIKTPPVKIRKLDDKTVALENEKGLGVKFRFARPRTFSIVANGLKAGEIQMGRVEVPLKANLRKGESLSLSYRIVPE